MAKVQVQMPDEFLGKISKLGKHTDEITERALQAGAKVVEAQFRTNLSSSIGQGSVFSDKAPDEYIVVVPLTENFDYFADNQPQVDIHEARISIFTKGNYLSIKNAVVKAFLAAEFTVTNRQYIGYEADTGYHHYNVDLANYYETEDI